MPRLVIAPEAQLDLQAIRDYIAKDDREAARRFVLRLRDMACMLGAACVTVCPTGASYKRAEDGIVLVDEDLCIGCGLCAWACPYGARELDADQGVMKKCTLCIDRIYNVNLAEEDRTPACVRACPTGARHFGDLADPDWPLRAWWRSAAGST